MRFDCRDAVRLPNNRLIAVPASAVAFKTFKMGQRMGNWISVYCDEPDALRAIVGSKSEAKFAAVLAEGKVVLGSHEEDIAAALRHIVDGDFSPAEQPGGGYFVYAFEKVCHACATHKTTVEIYVDDDMFPEMWSFVWDAAEAPQGLPVSEYGSPAVGYWDAGSVPIKINVLKQLDYKTVAERNRGHSYKSEIAEILEVLEAARERGRGVYVFFNE